MQSRRRTALAAHTASVYRLPPLTPPPSSASVTPVRESPLHLPRPPPRCQPSTICAALLGAARVLLCGSTSIRPSLSLLPRRFLRRASDDTPQSARCPERESASSSQPLGSTLNARPSRRVFRRGPLAVAPLFSQSFERAIKLECSSRARNANVTQRHNYSTLFSLTLVRRTPEHSS